MKLTWQSMRKSINTRNDHAHMGIKTCIKNAQNMSGYVPGPPVTNALSWNKISESRIDKIMRMSRNRINQTINQSVIQLHMWGPHQSPFIFAWINSINLITWESQNFILAYFKTFQKIMKDLKIACRIESGSKFY